MSLIISTRSVAIEYCFYYAWILSFLQGEHVQLEAGLGKIFRCQAMIASPLNTLESVPVEG